MLVRGGGEVLASIKDSAANCADVLEVFNDSWLLAREAASVFRLLGNIQNGSGSPTDGNGSGLPCKAGLEAGVSLGTARELIEETMGRSSVYCGVLDAMLCALSEHKTIFALALGISGICPYRVPV